MRKTPTPAFRRWLKRMAEGAVRRDGPPAVYRAVTDTQVATTNAKIACSVIYGDDERGKFRFTPTTPIDVGPEDAFVWQSTNNETVGATLNGKWIEGRIERYPHV